MKRKTDLEAAKTKLTWQKKRQKLEKHRKKQLLLVAVETLANEVKELSTEGNTQDLTTLTLPTSQNKGGMKFKYDFFYTWKSLFVYQQYDMD